MITFKDKYFRLDTENTCYIFRLLETGQLEHLYYGGKIAEQDYKALHTKNETGMGSTVLYPGGGDKFSLDIVQLEYSGIGRGDYRLTPLEVKMPDKSFVTDFVYGTHKVYKGAGQSGVMPLADGREDECETLEITMADKAAGVTLSLIYTVFSECNVIARRAVLRNDNEKPLAIRKFMSMMLDLNSSEYDFVTFDGGWIKEAHKHVRPLGIGTYSIESTTGNSSNRHNPAFILAKKGTGEASGEAIGINLIYSGNHYSAVNISANLQMRVMTGINPHCFEWELNYGETFETPQAAMSVTESGFNGLSHNMHRFVNGHIVRGEYKGKERPVLINNWEAHFFDFNQRKLLKLARGAAALGIELFVLDDGWFGARNDDKAGLGDWTVNRRKLPSGLGKFGRKLNKIGLKFGLWFEPEMVNEDSGLFRAHPGYAVSVPGRRPCEGRNQLVLDLCRKEVRDYIVNSVNSVLKSAEIAYVKWDMNRHISDMYSPVFADQGKFFHGYILGLYDILRRIVYGNPGVLFEGCASGGNRFDLGILCFMPQIWASDNTDPVERLKIQGGLSYMYPQSVMGAHVSMSPHQQTLRNTPLSTRFNAAAFGLLGYELDLKHLKRSEKKEIARQVETYKGLRKTFQYGRFYRFDNLKENNVRWQVSGEGAFALGNFQTLAEAAPPAETVRFAGLDKNALYRVETLPQTLSVRMFGGLIKHALPLKVSPDGFIVRTVDKYYRLPDAAEEYTNRGDLLMSGIKISRQFMGTWYNKETRLLGDSGSQIYIGRKSDIL